ncbi:hypothetical protein CN636_23255 [Bacillus toyonensis]|nr:hypothetical protein CN636_23255 [Bacillus toyonensis]
MRGELLTYETQVINGQSYEDREINYETKNAKGKGYVLTIRYLHGTEYVLNSINIDELNK